MIEAKVIADSISEDRRRITTLQVKFHRFILSEFNTHRVFSRNFSSSRAIPTAKLLEQVRNDPAMPVFWGVNQAGMQAVKELTGLERTDATTFWKSAAEDAAFRSEWLSKLGVHKQVTNRLIEPFVWVHGVVTSTEWDNFFQLRCHPDAQPEMQALAYAMRDAMMDSIPKILKRGEWHLPYITDNDIIAVGAIDVGRSHKNGLSSYALAQVSAARCCRVSYQKHDGTNPSVAEDLTLFEKLAGQVPIHASPLEHQAMAAYFDSKSNNFIGWFQFRHLWEAEQNMKDATAWRREESNEDLDPVIVNMVIRQAKESRGISK